MNQRVLNISARKLDSDRLFYMLAKKKEKKRHAAAV